MSSINPEMLKQLLAEFEEKQAVCREEINAITDQITELEKRIESSKERLVSVSRDREKIGLMRQRYQEGDWSSVLLQIQKNGNSNSQPTGEHSLVMPTVLDSQAASSGQQMQQPVAPEPPSMPEPLPAPALPSMPEPLPAPAPPSMPEPLPAPAPDFSMAQPPAQSNPFEQPPPLGAAPAAPMEAPAWDAQQQPFQDVATQAQPAAPSQPQGEGLFPFSGQPQPAAEGGADIPWAPPPSMTWESVSHDFPNQGGPPEPQPPQFQQPAPQPQPPPFGDPSQYPPQPGFQVAQPTPDMASPAPPAFGDPNAQMPGPPAGFMTPPPPPTTPPPAGGNAVLTTAFDDEFDISDALRSEDESNQDPRDSDKKIKDALRGLFS